MYCENSNWFVNANEVITSGCSIKLTTRNQVNIILDYMEWLLPFDCFNKDITADDAGKIIIEHGAVFIRVGYFCFVPRIGRASRIDLSPSETPSFGGVVLNWKDLKHPVFDPSERDDLKLPVNVRKSLQYLLDAYN